MMVSSHIKTTPRLKYTRPTVPSSWHAGQSVAIALASVVPEDEL